MVSVEGVARRAMTWQGPARFVGDRDGVQLRRLLWLGPLAVAVSLLVNLALKIVVQALDPTLADMGQLGRPLVTLTLEGAILGVLAFALLGWLLPHPIRAYRIVAVIAFLLSLVPDILLGFGGEGRRLGLTMMGPFFRLASLFPGSSGGGARPAAGSSAVQALSALPWERVIILMLLHVGPALVCILMLTTLTRGRARAGAERLPANAATPARR